MKAFTLFMLTLCLAHSRADDPCAADPCKDLTTARKCGMVNYCISQQDSVESALADHGNVCLTCLRVVKRAQLNLEDNNTVDSFHHLFTTTCNSFQEVSLKNQCNTIAEELAKISSNIMVNELDEHAVCNKIKFCGKNLIPKFATPCQRCRNFMANVRNMANYIPKQKVLNSAINLCQYLGTFTSACVTYLNDHGDELYTDILKALDESPCTKVLKCSPEPTPAADGVTDGSFCSLCTTAYQVLKEEYLSLNLNVSDICQLLTGRTKVCQFFVNEHTFPIVQAFDNMCYQNPCASLAPPRRFHLPGPKDACTSCRMTSEVMYDKLLDPKNSDTLKNIKFMCWIVPAVFREPCEIIIDTITTNILPHLAHHVHPRQLCHFINLCATPHASSFLLSSDKANNFQSVAKMPQHYTDEKCTTCLAVVPIILKHQEMLSGSYDFKDNARKICAMTSQPNPRCSRMVSDKGASMVILAKKGLVTSEVCHALEFCNFAKHNLAQQTHPSPFGQSDCHAGPSFWCLDWTNAIKCNALKFCEDNYWAKDLQP